MPASARELFVAFTLLALQDFGGVLAVAQLTRYHGVFAPNSARRARVTKARRDKGAIGQAAAETDHSTPAERRPAMAGRNASSAFNIDIETCAVCGGAMCIIACIEDAGG